MDRHNHAIVQKHITIPIRLQFNEKHPNHVALRVAEFKVIHVYLFI